MMQHPFPFYPQPNVMSRAVFAAHMAHHQHRRGGRAIPHRRRLWHSGGRAKCLGRQGSAHQGETAAPSCPFGRAHALLGSRNSTAATALSAGLSS